MRPRANTISHVDHATVGMLAAATSSMIDYEPVGFGLNHHSNMGELPGVGGYSFRGMSTATGHHGHPHELPKLETSGLTGVVSPGLRTAPPYGNFGGETNMENLWFGPGSTVNPAQLHFSNSPQSLAFEPPASPCHPDVLGMPVAHATLDDDGNFAWLDGFENQVSFNGLNEQAVDGSSPSVISTGSHSGLSEVMLDNSSNSGQSMTTWQNPAISQSPATSNYPMDWSVPGYHDLLPSVQLSPKSLQAQLGANDQYFPRSLPLNVQTPVSVFSNYPCFHPPMIVKPETPGTSAASVGSSNRQSSVTSVSTDSFTDALRQTHLANLSHSSVDGQSLLKGSQPPRNSPSPTECAVLPCNTAADPLPSTADLERYVAAYVQYFHPHLPFLHIPSLALNALAYHTPFQELGSSFHHADSTAVGVEGPLILTIAAVGALYENDKDASRELFETAKRVTPLHLEEGWKPHPPGGINGSLNTTELSVPNTPLWLVQAMLLNVIYGHQCEDKASTETASIQRAALVSLARSAGLTNPFIDIPHGKPESLQRPSHLPGSYDVQMSGNDISATDWVPSSECGFLNCSDEWHTWRLVEERKRTLYAVFIVTSLLASGSNHAPTLTNSEIRLDLPCSENVWAADSAEAWRTLRGSATAEQDGPSFASALSFLLTAGQRPPNPPNSVFMPSGRLSESDLRLANLPESELKPSTFGCLILINALHNYVWETRQRHLGRQWTTQEIEAMHALVEPALKAWQAAWGSNPYHSLERPNPSGSGPLSADCIPLLDLAYIRLFVNLGREKEAFWQQDYNPIPDELVYSTEVISQADRFQTSFCTSYQSTAHSTTSNKNLPISGGDGVKIEAADTGFHPAYNEPTGYFAGPSSKHERHLRKAALYAANALLMSSKLGVTFADLHSRELPIQSAICAYDAGQVLAEWVSGVQERVGRFLGILGRDRVQYSEMPAIILLDDEDCKLLEKIKEILDDLEAKLVDSQAVIDSTSQTSVMSCLQPEGCDFGSKILLMTALMLKRAPIWPGELSFGLQSLNVYYFSNIG